MVCLQPRAFEHHVLGRIDMIGSGQREFVVHSEQVKHHLITLSYRGPSQFHYRTAPNRRPLLWFWPIRPCSFENVCAIGMRIRQEERATSFINRKRLGHLFHGSISQSFHPIASQLTKCKQFLWICHHGAATGGASSSSYETCIIPTCCLFS